VRHSISPAFVAWLERAESYLELFPFFSGFVHIIPTKSLEITVWIHVNIRREAWDEEQHPGTREIEPKHEKLSNSNE
jgi:hypothetical protein